jgi:hypothetical protein
MYYRQKVRSETRSAHRRLPRIMLLSGLGLDALMKGPNEKSDYFRVPRSLLSAVLLSVALLIEVAAVV